MHALNIITPKMFVKGQAENNAARYGESIEVIEWNSLICILILKIT